MPWTGAAGGVECQARAPASMSDRMVSRATDWSSSVLGSVDARFQSSLSNWQRKPKVSSTFTEPSGFGSSRKGAVPARKIVAAWLRREREEMVARAGGAAGSAREAAEVLVRNRLLGRHKGASSSRGALRGGSPSAIGRRCWGKNMSYRVRAGFLRTLGRRGLRTTGAAARADMPRRSCGLRGTRWASVT